MPKPQSAHELICDPDALRKLPIFPLPQVTFFPHTLLPLHIFEPRYRQMTQHVEEGSKLIGIASVVGPDEQIASVGGLGRLVHSEKLPDGRYHILLQGLGRLRIDETDPDEGILYRTCCATLLDDQEEDAAQIEREMATVNALVAKLCEQSPDCASRVGDLPMRIEQRSILADVLCASLVQDPDLRIAALAETRVSRRLQFAADALATLLLEHTPMSAETEN